MAHGVARDVDDIPRYYAHIRHGQPLSPAVQQELIARYQAIGGHSPLAEITQSLADRLEAELNRRHDAQRFRVLVGFRHSPPFIRDAVEAMGLQGVTEALGLVLAPHYSAMSVGRYMDEAEQAIKDLDVPLTIDYIRQWYDQPSFIRLLAERVQTALAKIPTVERGQATVIFTAHSLPRRILETADPYPEQLQKTASLVAEVVGLERYAVSWQSAGRTPEPWLGPDLLAKLHALRDDDVPAVVVCPSGFVSDHLEVLYDLDIQAHELAVSLGMRFERTRSLNDDPAFVSALADVVDQKVVHGA